MERIIIREEDNTFNVETLSSYDVAYVPGFGNNPDLFRTPTLVTSKYQFINLFGDSPITFTSEQSYPEAGLAANGFPTYAIPNYRSLVLDNTPMNLTSFADLNNEDGLSHFYRLVDISSEEEGTDWEPEDGINYFLVTGSSTDGWTVTYSTLPVEDGSTYIETYGPASGNLVYESNISPLEQNWYEGGNTTSPYKSTDTQIGIANDGTSIKSYYQVIESTAPMFAVGDMDPGYRYALYLLSLGMPVYYEQMNSANNYDIVELASDFESAKAMYGTTTESSGTTDTYISPYDQGWYYFSNNSYVKCTNPTIQYRTLADVTSDDTIWYIGADESIDSMYTGLSKRFMGNPDNPDYSFDSMGDYSIKYITSGGYPTFEYGRLSTDSVTGVTKVSSGLAEAMINMAYERHDSVALIDHTDNPGRTIYESDTLSVISQVRDQFSSMSSITASYGAMFTPWYECTHSSIAGDRGQNPNVFMPASLAYLSSLATQVKNNQTPWLAVAGVSRGKIPYFGSLHTNYALTNNVADSYQTVPSDLVPDYSLISINPITYIRQYGYCIWGNRTLRNNRNGTKATSFLNIRNVVSDIKKTLYEASQQLLFEQNTDILWIQFKSLISPILDTMISNSILSDYKLTKFNINPESGEPVPAYMILANIQIRPINSVEVFDLTVQIENNEVDVAEVE